jgi:hypothetical protein
MLGLTIIEPASSEMTSCEVLLSPLKYSSWCRTRLDHLVPAALREPAFGDIHPCQWVTRRRGSKPGEILAIVYLRSPAAERNQFLYSAMDGIPAQKARRSFALGKDLQNASVVGAATSMRAETFLPPPEYSAGR